MVENRKISLIHGKRKYFHFGVQAFLKQTPESLIFAVCRLSLTSCLSSLLSFFFNILPRPSQGAVNIIITEVKDNKVGVKSNSLSSV